MPVRVSRLALAVAMGGAGALRVTRLQFNAIYADRTKPVRVTRQQIQAVYADRTKPVRVSYLAVQALMSISQREPALPPPPDLDNSLPPTLEREYNPYRPTLPEEVESVDPALYDFMREQTEIQRKQHNVTQAGDSTFPWELLTKIGPERQFTLGSLGRFYHDDFGIIIARYCQFARVRQSDWLNGPVGFLTSDNEITWRVTNDLAASHPDLAVGLLGSFSQPKDDWYGWVVTQGANHVQIRVPVDYEPSRNDELVWVASDTLGPGIGRVLGRMVGGTERVNAKDWRVKAGGAFIDLEGPSIESLRALLGDDLMEQVRAVQKALADADFGNLPATLRDLIRRIDSQDAVIAELRTGPNLKLLEERITALERLGAGQALYDQITKEWQAGDSGLFDRITQLAEKINSIPNYESRIAGLEAQIDLLGNQNNSFRIPLVDGSIPPNLIYEPDGSLVFVEIFE